MQRIDKGKRGKEDRETAPFAEQGHAGRRQKRGNAMIETSVLIVGAGPVGLCLAMDLAMRGIAVTIAETRPAHEPPSVKCNHISSRTMEILRRLGLSREVRAAGLPDDYPNDIVFRPTASRPAFQRITIPCRRDRFTATDSPDSWWPTAEPPHRVNQIFFEPILSRRAAEHPGINILNRTQIDGYRQDEDGVTAYGRSLDGGAPVEIRADYLIGCDGGRSIIRKAIGATLHGDAVIQRVQSTYFRAPDLIDRIPGPQGWWTYLYHPARAGSLVAIDGRERWLLHNYLLRDEGGFDEVDRDACLRMLLGVGADFDYEILSNEDWIGRRLVADKFRDRRVFICGDSAHLWVPYAGYGMNAGIADAMNLSWLLAARLHGWGGDAILDAYEAERLPITEQVSRFAMSHAEKAIAERTSIPPEFLDDDAAGEAARAMIGEEAWHLHVQQFACAGLNYGYFYDASPLIIYDGEAPPAYTMYDYTPSTVPGCRLPHFMLADGRSLYDALGDEFTLIRFDPTVDVAPMLTAAKARNVPVQLLDVATSGEAVPTACRHALLLSRPDQHICWRGNAMPMNAGGVIDRISGRIVNGAAV